jgi:farnesol dehydrogenase
MKIFITGATGFIGAHLTVKLVGMGNKVHAIYRSKKKTENIRHENLSWFEGDITNTESLIKAMEGCEQAYHVAAYAAISEKQKGDFFRINVDGTINVLNSALKAGIRKVVVTSTAGVYGPSLATITNEATKPSVNYFTGYEKSKAEAEKLIKKRVTAGENIVIVNPTRVFGPGILNESNSVTIMIKKYNEGKWHFIPGNGESIGNYAFVDDVVSGHILAMERGRTGENYILGGENISYDTFFKMLKNISGKKRLLVRLPLSVMLSIAGISVSIARLTHTSPIITPAHVRKFNCNWNVSSQKAIEDLGYSITSFSEGLKKTLIWLMQNKIY